MLFADLKVGDVVAVCCGHNMLRSKVTRATATQFDAGGYTFNRKDGSRRGGNAHSAWALPLADQGVVAFFAKKNLQRAIEALPSASPEVLQQVLALLGV